MQDKTEGVHFCTLPFACHIRSSWVTQRRHFLFSARFSSCFLTLLPHIAAPRAYPYKDGASVVLFVDFRCRPVSFIWCLLSHHHCSSYSSSPVSCLQAGRIPRSSAWCALKRGTTVFRLVVPPQSVSSVDSIEFSAPVFTNTTFSLVRSRHGMLVW